MQIRKTDKNCRLFYSFKMDLDYLEEEMVFRSLCKPFAFVVESKASCKNFRVVVPE